MIIEALVPSAATPAPEDDFWYRASPWLPGTGIGQPITEEAAMGLSAVYACIRVRAETIGQLPLHLMEIDGKLRHKAIGEPLYHTLHDQPNHWQTKIDFCMMMQAHVDLRGNAYALYVPGTKPELIPLHPGRMQVFRLDAINDRPSQPDATRLGYLYTDLQGRQYRLLQDEVLHLRGLSLDGVLGLSPIRTAMRTFEVALQIEDHGLKYLTNAGKPSGALKMPEGRKIENTDQLQLLRDSWRDANAGKDLYTIAFLEDGMEWQQLGLNNEELEWLESAKLSDRHIAQIYRVPLHLIMDWERLTYNNAEQADLGFVKHTVLPICKIWEQALARDVIEDTKRFYARFAVEGLLRGDAQSRMEFYRGLWNIGVLSQNDIREWEDLNPIDGGDQHFVPQNMMPLSIAEQIVLAQNSGGRGGDTSDVEERKMSDMMSDIRTRVVNGFDEQTGQVFDNRELLISVAEDIAQHRSADTKRHAATTERVGDLGQRLINAEEAQVAGDRWAKAKQASIEEQQSDILLKVDVVGEAVREQITQGDTNQRQVIRLWIGNAAARLAAAEIAELSKRADKAAGDRGKFDAWAEKFFGDKHRDYTVKTLIPIVKAEPAAKQCPPVIANVLADRTITELTNADPVEVLATWREHRAGELRDIIEEELYRE